MYLISIHGENGTRLAATEVGKDPIHYQVGGRGGVACVRGCSSLGNTLKQASQIPNRDCGVMFAVTSRERMENSYSRSQETDIINLSSTIDQGI